MKNLIYPLVLLSFIFKGCFLFQPSPVLLIKPEFEGYGIAVLNFARQGSAFGSDIGKVAADKLTDAFFLTGRYHVIDRTLINKVVTELEIKSTEFLSTDDIQRIGLKLRANYLVLGRVYQASSSNEYVSIDQDQDMFLSFRIISVASSETVGTVNYKRKVTESPAATIDIMVDKIIKEMIKE